MKGRAPKRQGFMPIAKLRRMIALPNITPRKGETWIV